MAVSNNTFGIDISKKIRCKQIGSTRDWAKGTLDESSLKNIKMSYEESFGESYGKQVKESIDEALQGATSMVKKAVSMVQGLASGESVGDSISAGGGDSSKSGFTDALLNFGVAVASFTSNGETQLNGAIQKAIGEVPAVNVPTRKTIPGISIGFGDNIKINFRYGSCGIFNAKEEVYDPIKNIMTSLNKITVGKNGGITLAGAGGIPFELNKLMAKRDVFAYLANGNSGFSLSSALQDTKTVLKDTGSFVSSAKDKLKKVGQLEGLIEKVQDNPEKYAKSSMYQHKEGSGVDFLGMHLFDSKELTSTAKSYIPNLRKWAQPEGQTAANALLNSEYSKDYSDYIKEINEIQKKVDDDGQNIFKVLDGIVGFEPNMVIDIVHNAAQGVTQDCFEFGFMGENGTNIMYAFEDVVSFLKEATPKICIQGVPEKVTCSLDYSNPDKNGYPKSGTITIEKLWIVAPLATFASTFEA